MVLDRPLADAQSLVHNPVKFVEEIVQMINDKQSHPVIGEFHLGVARIPSRPRDCKQQPDGAMVA